MTRHQNIIRPVKLTTTLPEDIRAKLDLHLFSNVEGRVPKGAYQKFFIERIREFLSKSEPDFKATNLTEADYVDPGAIMEKTSVSFHEGRVLVQFPTKRQGLSMTPKAALQFASALVTASKGA